MKVRTKEETRALRLKVWGALVLATGTAGGILVPFLWGWLPLLSAIPAGALIGVAEGSTDDGFTGGLEFGIAGYLLGGIAAIVGVVVWVSLGGVTGIAIVTAAAVFIISVVQFGFGTGFLIGAVAAIAGYVSYRFATRRRGSQVAVPQTPEEAAKDPFGWRKWGGRE